MRYKRNLEKEQLFVIFQTNMNVRVFFFLRFLLTVRKKYKIRRFCN